MSDNATTVMRLLEFTDSAFPVGTFSFSNGLETAAGLGLVHDAATLEEYTRDIARQVAFTDGVAALHAYRSYGLGRYEGILASDRQAILCKMNAEARLMTRRMGKKLAELAGRIFPDPTVARWLGDIAGDRTPGTYPAAQGIVFAACGISERDLFCSHQYGAVNMVVSAALRWRARVALRHASASCSARPRRWATSMRRRARWSSTICTPSCRRSTSSPRCTRREPNACL